MNKFNEITDPVLRTFNRVQFSVNMRQDLGQAYTEEYINSFSDKEKQDMAQMLAFVRRVGWDQARKIINSVITLEKENG